MHIEEVFLHDIISVKFPDKEEVVPCRVTSINTDNVITATFFEDNKEKESRIDDEWIKGVCPYDYRDLSGRRVIVYCKD